MKKGHEGFLTTGRFNRRLLMGLYSHRNNSSELRVSPEGVFNDGDQRRFVDYP
jgi:hypothetical protein